VKTEAITIGMLALSVVLAAAAVIQRDRDFFFIWAGWSIISTILLVFIAPVLAVVKLILLVLGARYLVALYNTIINLDQNCELAIHDVTSSLVRREAVVPRIESYVGRYSNYEASTLIKAIRERGGRGAGLAVVFEAYPQLRANDQFTRLASELVSAEESILFARFKFNEAVAAYNRYLRQFPTLLFVRAMAFPDRDYLTA
jgi:LemA protein